MFLDSVSKFANSLVNLGDDAPKEAAVQERAGNRTTTTGEQSPIGAFSASSVASSFPQGFSAEDDAVDQVESLLSSNPEDFAPVAPNIGYPQYEVTSHQLEQYLERNNAPSFSFPSTPASDSDTEAVQYLLDNPEALQELNNRLGLDNEQITAQNRYEQAGSNPPETRVETDKAWLRESIQEGDDSSPSGTITIDGYGELPIGVPTHQGYTGRTGSGEQVQTFVNSDVEDGDWRTVEIVRANSQFQETGFWDQLAAGVSGSAGFNPFTAVDQSAYDGAFFSEDGSFYIPDDASTESPQGSKIPSDFTPPDAPGTTPRGGAVGGAAELLQIGTQAIATRNGLQNASHALGQVHVQVNSDGEYRAVVQLVQVSQSSTGEGLTSKPVYVTYDDEEGGLSSIPVDHADPGITDSGGPVIRQTPGGDSDVTVDPSFYAPTQSVEQSSLPPISEA